MEKNIVKINESTLRKIVAESVKTVLNEIGDTPAGRAMLARATDRAHDLGRSKQGWTFLNGLTNATKEAFGDGATYNTYKYQSARGYMVILSTMGLVTITDSDGSNKSSCRIEELFHSSMDRYFKTDNIRLARQIAKWCAERLEGSPVYDKLCDWHTWAAQ